MRSTATYLSKSAHDSYIAETPKSPKIGIAQLQKKFYPLNLTLTSSHFEDLPSLPKKYQKHQAFIDEFVSFSPKSSKKPASKIDTRNTFTCGFGYTDYTLETPRRDLHPPVCVEIPAVSYFNLKNNRPNSKSLSRKEEMYHPNVVFFSQRSKMVLYSQTPMQYLPVPAKKMKLKGLVTNPEYFKNKTGKNYENLQRPQNFEQKLKRLRDIIKDPLIYEN